MNSVTVKNVDSYPMNKKKLCCIINNEYFDSSLNLAHQLKTTKDFDALVSQFEKMDFTVEKHKNCTRKKMCDTLVESLFFYLEIFQSFY